MKEKKRCLKINLILNNYLNIYLSNLYLNFKYILENI